jgi:uncharacterized protein YjbJ (UPF0337 family)
MEMNRDKLEGTAKDVAGKVQRKAGELTGDTSQEAAGAAKQVEGKTQKTVGKVKDAADDIVERDRADVRPRSGGGTGSSGSL